MEFIEVIGIIIAVVSVSILVFWCIYIEGRRNDAYEMLKDMNLNELEKLRIKGQLIYGPFFSLQSGSIDEIHTLVEDTVEDKNLSI